jgi:branched-chain amino acid transport system ATP-binding protein
MTPVLHVRGVSVAFGAVLALDRVDLDVPDGSLTALIGPNGAGKTTLIDAICGLVPYRGRILLDGDDLRDLPPHARARQGIARTWQNIELFNDLTVRENLAVAARVRLSDPEIDEALAAVGMGWAVDAMPTQLSQGQRKLVGVARALAPRPRLLCLDEPAAGLDSRETQELAEHLGAIARGGTSMLLVDHDMQLVLGACDHVVVLKFGAVLATGAPEAVRADSRVIEAYLGSAAQEITDTDLELESARIAGGAA